MEIKAKRISKLKSNENLLKSDELGCKESQLRFVYDKRDIHEKKNGSKEYKFPEENMMVQFPEGETGKVYRRGTFYKNKVRDEHNKVKYEIPCFRCANNGKHLLISLKVDDPYQEQAIDVGALNTMWTIQHLMPTQYDYVGIDVRVLPGTTDVMYPHSGKHWIVAPIENFELVEDKYFRTKAIDSVAPIKKNNGKFAETIGNYLIHQ